MPIAETVMAEVTAAVACKEAARTRRPVAIGHAPGCWRVGDPEAPLAGERTLITVQPGEIDSVGMAKRIVGMLLAGQTVPRATLEAFTPPRRPQEGPKVIIGRAGGRKSRHGAYRRSWGHPGGGTAAAGNTVRRLTGSHPERKAILMLIQDLDLLTAETDELPPVGSLSILNVGAGDLKFTFSKDKPNEVERAKKTIDDMLKRGYTLLVEVDGVLHKAKGFDPEREEYIILDPPDRPLASDAVADVPVPGPVPKKRGRPKGVPMATTRATAVAPTAGG